MSQTVESKLELETSGIKGKAEEKLTENSSNETNSKDCPKEHLIPSIPIIKEPLEDSQLNENETVKSTTQFNEGSLSDIKSVQSDKDIIYNVKTEDECIAARGLPSLKTPLEDGLLDKNETVKSNPEIVSNLALREALTKFDEKGSLSDINSVQSDTDDITNKLIKKEECITARGVSLNAQLVNTDTNIGLTFFDKKSLKLHKLDSKKCSDLKTIENDFSSSMLEVGIKTNVESTFSTIKIVSIQNTKSQETNKLEEIECSEINPYDQTDKPSSPKEPLNIRLGNQEIDAKECFKSQETNKLKEIECSEINPYDQTDKLSPSKEPLNIQLGNQEIEAKQYFKLTENNIAEVNNDSLNKIESNKNTKEADEKHLTIKQLKLSVEQNKKLLSEVNSGVNITKEECSITESEILSDDQDLRQEKHLRGLDKDLLSQLKDMPEILDYIRKLEKTIEKQIKKIIKWKRKAKQKYTKTKDAFTQTKDSHFKNKTSTNISDNSLVQQIQNKAAPKSTQVEEKSKSLIDDITEAAENALQHSGFVYEETSGMYYDYNTGYYYNAECGLYYDGNSGTYLTYNQDSNSYDFHVQVPVVENKIKESKIKVKRKNSGKKEKEAKRQKKEDKGQETHSDQEEGECSESGSSSSNEVKEDEVGSSSEDDVSKQWPPCMRIIIEKTEDPKLKTGSLHIITCDGGSIGREGIHSILIRDVNVSKHHLKIEYDKEKGTYMLLDLGSRNGTLLNGKRISPAKQESEPQEVVHGSKIQIGSTVLLCHIHNGNQTCGHCEPGLLLIPEPKKEVLQPKPKSSMSDRYRTELRNLKMKQGLLGLSSDGENIKLKPGYTDRAQKRRDTVGSQNPYEKTESASLEKNIPAENKGFKLLQKMGWKEGQPLGKEDGGLLEPIPMVSNPGTAGIGTVNPVSIINLPKTEKTKKVIWKKTQERFEKLPDTKAFLEDNSD